MSKHIMRCPKCKQYTMKALCSRCNEKTSAPKPPKYSPEDHYGSYRRQAKRDGYEERGLI